MHWALALLLIFIGSFSSLAAKRQQINTVSSIAVGAEQPRRYLPLLANKKVGLVVNQTSRAFDQHLVDYLLSQRISISAVFAPEHGFRGNLGAGEKVKDSLDPATGIAIRSLYGKHKKPNADMLRDIDVLIFDMQDVGARFYTYISTLHYVLEAAAENAVPVVVFDRPNPSGRFVDGPTLDVSFRSFVGVDPLPVLHGLTLGELALMIQGEAWIAQAENLELTVITVANYRKSDRYPLPVPPSPNLPTQQAIALYPSLCLFEATTVSVGRGTPWPFQVLGHDKVVLGDFKFTPTPLPQSAPYPKLEGISLQGLSLQSSVIEGFDITLLHRLYHEFAAAGETFIDRPDFFDLLSGSATLRLQLAQGLSTQQIKASWQQDLSDFKQRRKPYLRYPID